MRVITHIANLSVNFQNTRPLDTHDSAKVQSFKHFRSALIAACTLPGLQCFDKYEDYGCFPPPDAPLVCLRCFVITGRLMLLPQPSVILDGLELHQHPA